jgi:pantoate--beta-alanine ligase
MIVIEDIPGVRREVAAARRRGQTIGVVPTMGALHAGHVSLMEAARRECGYVAATIFVNPTQFAPTEDFSRYPRPLENDLQLCRRAGVDLVFHPAAEVMYPENLVTAVEIGGPAALLEGEFRPGHFRGVATVVLKLFNIVQPDIAYFGQKDYQQQLLIRRMCRDLNVPVEVRTCPTVREPDGLAMSSRNVYLAPDERARSLALSHALELAKRRLEEGDPDVPAVRRSMQEYLRQRGGIEVDYATIAHPETLEEIASPLPEMVALIAARVGTTRLIDNMIIHRPG